MNTSLSIPKKPNSCNSSVLAAASLNHTGKNIPKILTPRVRGENGPLLMLDKLNSSNASVLSSASLNQTTRNITKNLHAHTPRMKENIPATDEVKFPMPGASALKSYKAYLSSWEQGEILDYNKIYFIGNHAKKSHLRVGPNNGFDDDRGDYKISLGDHICYRYEVNQQLGKGSFGQVFKAYDHKDKEFVAMKIIRNKSRFHQQGVVEVKVLKALKDHDSQDRYNVVHIKDFFIFRKHLCITFELLSINLYDFIKSNHFHGLSLPLIRRFAYQILQCLKLSHRLGIIHCDLKPENILLRQSNKSSLKVIDFGSSCYEDQKLYTYIQSRFYRAPEIMLGIPYTTGIDMWSFGCILVELYTGYPLFPGESELEQLQCIMEVKGIPPYSILQQSTRSKLFFDPSGYPKITANSRGKKHYPSTKELKEILRDTDAPFQDFIEKCLEWDPERRIKAEEALKHMWIMEGISRPPTSSTPKAAEIPKPTHKHKLSYQEYAKSTRHSKPGSFLF
ncbi:unnamed protein product [Blepharisma stoltei]|uniref:dual-specificity kinase n=1 Tax=Blepharisma stoltei TaxID=1481888 RepID=A0AAU9JJM9_9CILI|nr:unnamed protein product [Blepharisma stoltei]